MDTQSHTFDDDGSRKLQALSRELNERLRRLAQSNGKDGSLLLLLCECGRCSEAVEVPADFYGQALATPGVLLVKQDHAPANPVRSQNGHASLVEAAAA